MNKLKKIFVKNVKIPIQIFEEPYFTYYLKLYNLKEQYDEFFNDYKDGYEDPYKIIDKIVNHIRSKDIYNDFIKKDFNQYSIGSHNLPSKPIFTKENDKNYFISIDMKKANFHALKKFNNELVDNKEDYKEFISQFTNDKHFINSKYYRQVLFGNLSHKRISTIQKYYMFKFVEVLTPLINKEDVVFFSDDEIVIKYDKLKHNFEKIKSTIEHYGDEIGFPIKTELFVLYKLSDDRLGYVKKFLDHIHDKGYRFNKLYEIKGCLPNFYAQAYKEVNYKTTLNIKDYLDQRINEYDLLHYVDGEISQFKYTISKLNVNLLADILEQSLISKIYGSNHKGIYNNFAREVKEYSPEFYDETVEEVYKELFIKKED